MTLSRRDVHAIAREAAQAALAQARADVAELRDEINALSNDLTTRIDLVHRAALRELTQKRAESE